MGNSLNQRHPRLTCLIYIVMDAGSLAIFKPIVEPRRLKVQGNRSQMIQARALQHQPRVCTHPNQVMHHYKARIIYSQCCTLIHQSLTQKFVAFELEMVAVAYAVFR